MHCSAIVSIRDREPIYYHGPHGLRSIAGGPQYNLNYLPTENKVKNQIYVKEQAIRLFTYSVRMMGLRFDAMLCTNLTKENYSDVFHILTRAAGTPPLVEVTKHTVYDYTLASKQPCKCSCRKMPWDSGSHSHNFNAIVKILLAQECESQT